MEPSLVEVMRSWSSPVADGRRHAAEKGRDLRSRLREAEDVVDEQEHVLALVAEVLRSGEAGERHAHAGSWRLVHLTVYQAGLLDDARLAHLEVEVGSLAGALADAREDRGAAVLLREVVDELLDEDRLADARAAKEARLAAADVGLEKVDRLDARLEDLGLGGELVKGGRGVVDRVVLHVVGRALAVDRLAHDVPHAAERGGADGHHHGMAGVAHLEAAGEAVGRGHGHRADDAARKLRLDLEDRAHVPDGGVALDGKGGVDARHLPLELHVDDRADDAHDRAHADGAVELAVGRLLERGARLGVLL